MSKLSKKINEIMATNIVAVCEDAYSFNRWSEKGFYEVALLLLERSFTSQEIIAVLYSKEMRWAADCCAKKGEEHNFIPAIRFTEYENGRNNSGCKGISRQYARNLCWAGMPAVRTVE